MALVLARLKARRASLNERTCVWNPQLTPLNRVGRPVILVGHSYGGATITAAGVDERVVGLVYIAAVAPDAGETVQDQLDKYPSDIFSRVEVSDGRAWMLPNGSEFFAGDISKDEQKLVWATHYAPVSDLFHQQKLGADRIAWKSKPSWYVLATKDHTVHPDLQRWVSKRMGATVTEVESSHVPRPSSLLVKTGLDVNGQVTWCSQNGTGQQDRTPR